MWYFSSRIILVSVPFAPMHCATHAWTIQNPITRSCQHRWPAICKCLVDLRRLLIRSWSMSRWRRLCQSCPMKWFQARSFLWRYPFRMLSIMFMMLCCELWFMFEIWWCALPRKSFSWRVSLKSYQSRRSTKLASGLHLIANQTDVDQGLKEKCKCFKSCRCTWFRQLTPMQQTRLRNYELKWQERYRKRMLLRFFHANDTPEKRMCWSGESERMPTLRACMGPLWVQNLRRPVLGREMLCSLGWRRTPANFPSLSEGQLRKLCGNSMHLASVTSILMIALACTKA